MKKAFLLPFLFVFFLFGCPSPDNGKKDDPEEPFEKTVSVSLVSRTEEDCNFFDMYERQMPAEDKGDWFTPILTYRKDYELEFKDNIVYQSFLDADIGTVDGLCSWLEGDASHGENCKTDTDGEWLYSAEFLDVYHDRIIQYYNKETCDTPLITFGLCSYYNKKGEPEMYWDDENKRLLNKRDIVSEGSMDRSWKYLYKEVREWCRRFGDRVANNKGEWGKNSTGGFDADFDFSVDEYTNNHHDEIKMEFNGENISYNIYKCETTYDVGSHDKTFTEYTEYSDIHNNYKNNVCIASSYNYYPAEQSLDSLNRPLIYEGIPASFGDLLDIINEKYQNYLQQYADCEAEPQYQHTYNDVNHQDHIILDEFSSAEEYATFVLHDVCLKEIDKLLNTKKNFYGYPFVLFEH